MHSRWLPIALTLLTAQACEREPQTAAAPPAEDTGSAQIEDTAGASATPTPPDVSAPTPETSGEPLEPRLDTGASHACVLRSGQVWCWGAGSSGQLGDGAGEDSARPVAVTGLPEVQPVEEIALGLEHSCARTRDGQVWCWGSGAQGELGDGAQERRLSAVRVAELPPAKQIAAGSYSSCALTRDHRVYCWGGPSAFEVHAVARPIPALSSAREIALGDHQLCARMPSGAVRCVSFQTGRAAEVPGLQDAVALAMSPHDALGCALRESGLAQCWAPSADGALGLASLPLSEPLRGLSTGPHSCALGEGGDVRCWGVGRDGALGDGARERREEPVSVALPSPAREISVGEGFSCALVGGADVWCWGSGERGQLGGGEPGLAVEPSRVALSE